ncbi:hypothetical protein [Methanococcus voltae]|uniref:restriction endonuclease n=1 Tax=Methanococcus voltae TaxID=2188 RepID=UPI003AEF7D9E
MDKNTNIKNAYCVFESKGDIEDINLRKIETIKIECAKKHFEAISGENVLFKAVSKFKDIEESIL